MSFIKVLIAKVLLVGLIMFKPTKSFAVYIQQVASINLYVLLSVITINILSLHENQSYMRVKYGLFWLKSLILSQY